MTIKKYLAFDLGASSGRAIVGILENEILKLEQLYRFPNEGIKIFNSTYWDILGIFHHILEGLKKYVKSYGNNVDGIGIDTWGVDHVLLDANDEIIGPVHHYRDTRTEGMLEEMFKVISKKEIFNQTGIQFMPLNTSVQLFSMVKSNSPRLSIVRSILMLPDYFNFLLSGIKKSEFSHVSTSQLYNPIIKNWAFDLIKMLGLQPSWFGEIIPPGTVLGAIQKYICEETGLNSDSKIIAPACHDTASAVAAVPVDMEVHDRGEWAYLSSGTWSLLGVELENPLINEKALKFNFTNEGGVDNTFRFLKNISGLWLIQEVKKIWDENVGETNWEDIMQMASTAPKFKYYIDPDDSSFLNPPNMIKAIENFCLKTSQEVPTTIGEFARTIFESLAFRYRRVLDYLEEILNKRIKILHIIGGGSQNTLLNQFTANAVNLPVKAGPSEATVIGNILIQAMAKEQVKSINHLRSIVRNSFPIESYFPKDTMEWNQAYSHYISYWDKEI